MKTDDQIREDIRSAKEEHQNLIRDQQLSLQQFQQSSAARQQRAHQLEGEIAYAEKLLARFDTEDSGDAV